MDDISQESFAKLWPQASKILKLLHVPAEGIEYVKEVWRLRKDQPTTRLYAFIKGFNEPPRVVYCYAQSSQRTDVPDSIVIRVQCEKYKEPREKSGDTHAFVNIFVSTRTFNAVKDDTTLARPLTDNDYHWREGDLHTLVSCNGIEFDWPYNPNGGRNWLHKQLCSGMITPMMRPVLELLLMVDHPSVEARKKAKAPA